MLTGAFAAVAGSYLATSATVGTLIAMTAGAALSLVLAYGAVSRQGDPIVIGVAVNLLALGLTSFLVAPIVRRARRLSKIPRVDGLDRFPIPLLSEIPIVGPAIFRSTIPGYLAMLAVPALWVFLFRTPIGLRLRGVGERPMSAETLGVSPTQYKYAAVVASGMLAA